MSQQGRGEFSEQEVQERFEAIGKQMVEPGLYAEAIEAYKGLIRDYPGSRWAANAYLAIAQCHHALGNEEEELATLEDIIAQFPDHVVARRAQGAITALRERHYGTGAPGADLHSAVRRLTRQVERMREGERRRAWLAAGGYVVVVVLVLWVAAKSNRPRPDAALSDLEKRVAAVESALEAVSAAPGPAAPAPAPSATVIPIEPEPGPQAAPRPAPRQQPVRPESAARPTPKPPQPAPAAAAGSYAVQEGDSLWTIARRELGDARRADEIARLNGLQPPFNIRVGDKLKLPPK